MKIIHYTGTEKKQKDEIRNFIIDAFGVALLFVAFMMIIPTPIGQLGTVRCELTTQRA